MTIFTGIIVFLLIFWTILFTILPWGNQAPDEQELGHAGSAPLNPRIKKKFMITFLISAILWCIISYLIHTEIVDFYGIAQEMMREDEGL